MVLHKKYRQNLMFLIKLKRKKLRWMMTPHYKMRKICIYKKIIITRLTHTRCAMLHAPSKNLTERSVHYVLGYYTMCWNNTLCAGILHYVLGYYTMCWNTTLCAGVLHYVLEYYTMCWNTTLCAGILHYVLEYYTMCWDTTLCAGVLHYVLKYYTMC